MNTPSPNQIRILSARIDCLNFGQVYQRLQELVNQAQPAIVVTPNPEIILQAQTDKILMSVINQSDLSIPDGTGLIWAAKYNSLPLSKIPIIRQIQAFIQVIWTLLLHLINPEYGHDIIPERITGTDIIPELAKICADSQQRIFFLGAGPGVAQEAAKRLRAINPHLEVVGAHSGHWPSKYDEENRHLINQAQPDCLILAFGAPREQHWINRNLTHLPSVKLVIGIGGGLDFIAESVSVLGGKQAIRAPQWMRQLKLEWLHRLLYQPNRWSRIFNAVFIFPVKVMLAKLKQ